MWPEDSAFLPQRLGMLVAAAKVAPDPILVFTSNNIFARRILEIAGKNRQKRFHYFLMEARAAPEWLSLHSFG